MLPKSEHVQQVYYAGDNSLLSASKPSGSTQGTKLFLECSTIDPAVTREVGSKITESGLGEFADAAVSVQSPTSPPLTPF
jgi:3-hydroxyisobutyrate dehydrogenase